MSPEIFFPLLSGAAAGGFVNGLAGSGMALLSLGIWLQVLPPWQAVSIVAAMSVASGLQGVWSIRRDLRYGTARLGRYLLPAFVGLPIGAAVLEIISAATLKLVVAGFLLLYGAFFMLRRSLPQMSRPTPVIDVLIGLLGGVLGGAAALSGVLLMMWFAVQPWTKNETSAVLRLFNLTILATAVGLFAWQGHYSRDTLVLTGVALPVTLIFSQVGLAVFRRLSDHQFRWLLVWLVFASGIVLALRELG